MGYLKEVGGGLIWRPNPGDEVISEAAFEGINSGSRGKVVGLRKEAMHNWFTEFLVRFENIAGTPERWIDATLLERPEDAPYRHDTNHWII